MKQVTDALGTDVNTLLSGLILIGLSVILEYTVAVEPFIRVVMFHAH